jgi:ATP synthase I chain
VSERDPAIRRIERYALVWCGVLAVAALALDPARPRAAAGVLGGAALVAFSYWAIKRGVDALLAAAAAKRSGRIVWHALVFAGRYALLAGIAYVMIARLRLHPVGLLGGASSIVLAIATEAVRGGRSKSR